MLRKLTPRLDNQVEYLAEGKYIIREEVSQTERSRVLGFVPNSKEWGSWLAGLKSFHFQGRRGHFTARVERKGGGCYWYAYRKAYGVQHRCYIGTSVTIEKLEKIAASIDTTILKSIPEDEKLVKQVQASSDSVTIGTLCFSWEDDILQIRPTRPGSSFLTPRQSAELLAFLYARRRLILKNIEDYED